MNAKGRVNLNKIITIPNILSLFRILLIPVFVVLYFNTGLDNHYWYAAGTLVFSGFTDVVDGFIARRFNMVSDVGKVLDPAADKLTQGAVVVCLCFYHNLIIFLTVLFFVKEICMLIGAMYLAKSGMKPASARWWGKLSTVVIYATMFLVVLSDIIYIPYAVIVISLLITTISMFYSLGSYYFGIFKEFRNAQKNK